MTDCRSIKPLWFCLPLALLLLGTISPATATTRTASVAAPCQTTVGGTVTGNTAWTLATNPYCIGSDVTVAQGATLTVEPGVTVRFDAARTLRVDGTLVARGTASSPITFTSNLSNPAMGDWYGVYFEDASTDASFDGTGNYLGGSVLQYMVIEYAGRLLKTQDGGAIFTEASSPYVDHCTIRQSLRGIQVYGSATPRLVGNTITDASYEGIFVITGASGVPAAGPVTIAGNTVSGNKIGGIHLIVSDTSVRISDNIITGNGQGPIDYGGGIGVIHNGSSSVVISNNNIKGNMSAYGGGVSFEHFGSGVRRGSVVLAGNSIVGNAAWDGGGAYIHSSAGDVVVVSGNTIADNTFDVMGSGYGSGGGMLLYGDSSSVTVSYNVISGNAAWVSLDGYESWDTRGGGVNITSSSSLGGVKVTGNVITRNRAGHGGGVSVGTTDLECNRITDNTGVEYGGGVAVEGNARLRLNNLYDNEVLHPSGWGSQAVPNDVYNGKAQDTPAVNAENNYWGTTDEATIRAHIWDNSDDSGLGVVDYAPFLTESVTIPPPPGLFLPLVRGD